MRPAPLTVVSSLRDMVDANPGRPLLTMYDDATGDRVELSGATFDNWVCKLVNLFVVDWDLPPAASIRVNLPAHWQTFVALVAAWSAGLVVTRERSPGVAASVVGPDDLGSTDHAADHAADHEYAGEVLACSLRPRGQRFESPLPAGWHDWGAEIPAQPDQIVLPRQVHPGDPGLLEPKGAISHAEILERGRAAAERLGLARGDRLLTDLNPASTEGLDLGLLAPLSVGASVVLLTHASETRRAVVSAQERVTCEAVS